MGFWSKAALGLAAFAACAGIAAAQEAADPYARPVSPLEQMMRQQQQAQLPDLGAAAGMGSAGAAPWRRISPAAPSARSGKTEVLLFCNHKSLWCAQLKRPLLEKAAANPQIGLRFVPIVAAAADVPLAQAQLAVESLGYFDLGLDEAFVAALATGRDLSTQKEVLKFVKEAKTPGFYKDFEKAYNDTTETQARMLPLNMRLYGIKSYPSLVVGGKCAIEPEQAQSPEDYLKALDAALLSCR